MKQYLLWGRSRHPPPEFPPKESDALPKLPHLFVSNIGASIITYIILGFLIMIIV